jgi:hypothetical protein
MASVRFSNRSTAPNPYEPETIFRARPRPGPVTSAPVPPSFGYQPPAAPPPGNDPMQELHGSGFGSMTDQPPSMANYWNDPMLQQYTDFATGAMNRLTTQNGPNPILADAINKLQGIFQSGNSGYEQFQGIANRRLEQLKSPLFSTGGPTDTPDAMRNSALLNTKFVEPLMQQRDAAQKRALDRASARGLGLTSGLTEEMARGVDSQFDQSLSQGYRDLMLHEVSANEGREQEAVGIGQLLASLAANPAQMSSAGQLAGIGQGLQGDDLRNLLSAVGVSQGMAQLPLQNMMAAGSMMNTLNNQPIPQADPTTNLIQLLMGMANSGEGAMNNAMNQQGGFWQQLFGALPGLMGQGGENDEGR